VLFNDEDSPLKKHGLCRQNFPNHNEKLNFGTEKLKNSEYFLFMLGQKSLNLSQKKLKFGTEKLKNSK
jgi:hypothetical protein